MSQFAVVVNGVPGSGKTTLCSSLGRVLGMPVISKDSIKEALAEAVDIRLPTERLGALASDVMWAYASETRQSLVIESFWFSGRDDSFFHDGLEVAGILHGVEIWCQAPVDVMRARFQTRPRHFAHQDSDRMDEWESFAISATPISNFPIIRVDTGKPVDVPAVARRILEYVGP